MRECRRSLLLLGVYFAALVVLGFGATKVYAALPADPTPPPAPTAEWVEIPRPQSTFELSLGDFIAAEPQWLARRHAQGGGRRDLLMWEGGSPDTPQFTMEFYRPGRESVDEADLPPVEQDAARDLPTKFGAFNLSAASPMSPQGSRCVYFFRHFDEPALRITGMACAKSTEAKLRELIACGVDRLSLASAGGDARLARLFARADLKRSHCGPGHPPTAALPHQGLAQQSLSQQGLSQQGLPQQGLSQQGAWIDGPQQPPLRR